MKHNIRINGEVKEIDCEFGSGILDKHGREIFEGDNVELFDEIYTFEMDMFYLGFYPINEYYSENMEIVGHVEG